MIDAHHLALHLNAGVVAGLGATVLVVAAALLALALWRRYWSERYYYLEESASTRPAPPDWDVKSAVPAHLFAQYVEKLRSGVAGFREQFEELQQQQQQLPPAIRSTNPDNREYNRYNNVLACKFILRIPFLITRRTFLAIRRIAVFAIYCRKHAPLCLTSASC